MFKKAIMKGQVSRIFWSLSKLFYALSAILVAFAVTLSAGIVPVGASPPLAENQQERIFCNFDEYEGTVLKVEDQTSPWEFTLTGPGYISVVGIKAATECAQIFTADGTSTCYGVSGIGTNSVTVWDLEDAPSSCREISHLEIVVIDPVPTETPELTSTPVDPTETSEPTSTPVDPTETPEPTSTPVDPTETPEPTSTPVDPTETPEPTVTPENPTSTPDPTDPPEEPTGTPEATATPVGNPTQTPVSTLPPPEVDDEGLLIPVTGREAPFSGADVDTKQAFLSRISAQSGLLVFGLGLIFHGVSLLQKKREI
ncbi:MAG: hypothetical protein KGY39_03910 [Anaerolineales bacterium]|nr:hypothetical protein [Anaerolineales bacterium]MBS3752358.1 hypothetical protein [Anaerolineales bacterium]